MNNLIEELTGIIDILVSEIILGTDGDAYIPRSALVRAKTIINNSSEIKYPSKYVLPQETIAYLIKTYSDIFYKFGFTEKNYNMYYINKKIYVLVG